MVITRTPFRISFVGGGTDYPTWYTKHGGAVVGATINKYCHITCRHLPPFFEHRFRVVYSKIENCSTIDDIQHPSVRETLKYLGIRHGVEIHHDGDLPARGGIGSSSAFTAGLVKAVYALQGRLISKHDLAREAIHVEQELLKETVGSQDQVLTAHGGINHVEFHTNGEFSVQPLSLTREAVQDFNQHLLLFFTGIHRTASDVAKTYVESLPDQTDSLFAIRQMVDRCLDILNRGDYIEFGRLLDEYWCIKQGLSEKISNSRIKDLYQAAKDAGAVGGKITGAGGGGYFLLVAPPSAHPRILQTFSNLVHIPFRFEFSGSSISHFDPGEDFTTQELSRMAQTIAPFQDASH